MSYANEFQNREMETRDPKLLIVVTKEHLDRYPEQRELLAKYYDKRADAPLDDSIRTSVKHLGYVHTPLFITNVPELGDVVIEGRQRRRAALEAGLAEVPVIFHTNDDKVNALLEASSNLARRQNTPAESAHVYQKLLQTGMSQQEIAQFVGVTPAAISYCLSVGEMPKIVHKYIEEGKLSPTAALALKKTYGKKAQKGSGKTTQYDDAEIKAALESMEEDARQAGGSKIKGDRVKQASNSKAGFAEGLTRKEWEALYEDSTTPDDYKALIGVFLNKISVATAVANESENLGSWLRKITPQPKPKKVKEPKVKGSKKDKEPVVDTKSEADLKSLFV